ncbi:Uu.00g053500.m01.CDS01 [Anthostomella pinea]|uniref:Uu.00g053500.m01.CDS01 n=1 Tax=Anthostomella pinea TaxID=933095 RepID=A0AAI8YPK6_9PEZI|nr:Uu.00g053500.m01.CDS01 [Anthostomella pinea]
MPESSKPQEKGKCASDPTNSSEPVEDPEESIAPERFPPEEEASLLGESNEKKSEANALFSSAKYENAINKYEEASSICPHYLDYELAVLKSNIAACHLKLEQYKEAIKTATESLDGLSRLEKAESKEQETGNEKVKGPDAAEEGEDEAEEEIISSGAQNSAPAVKEETAAETARRKRQDDIRRIRAKALMRRARARSELGGWSNLSGAEEDYKILSATDNLSGPDERLVRAQLRALPPRVKAAQETEMSEMWGKLKDLGNGILKPFGLSTQNFNMVKDEKTGGYSMNFNQNNPSQ